MTLYNDFDEVPDFADEDGDPCPKGCPLHEYGFFQGCTQCMVTVGPVLRWLLRQQGVPAEERHPVRGKSK